MAETSGLVQRIAVVTQTTTCVWIGPTPNNVVPLAISNDSTPASAAFASTLVQCLAAAAANYREVVCVHGASDSTITGVRIEPV